MHLFKTWLPAVLIGLCLVITTGCSDDDDDDNPTGPGQNTPAELVGTWDWVSAAKDGVPVADFAELSFTDTSTAQELTFNAGGTWETREYYQGIGPVYTRSGTCYDTDSLYITVTNENGTPVNESMPGTAWMVVGASLNMATKVVAGPDTVLVTSVYEKQ